MEGQPGWRFCDKCFGLFFNGDPDPNRKGRCPAGGAHHAQGFVFYLPHRAFPSPSIAVAAILEEGRQLKVSGMGFEPNQSALIRCQFTDTNSTTSQLDPESVKVDPSGNFIHKIPVNRDIQSATVSAFDFGSGETASASI